MRRRTKKPTQQAKKRIGGTPYKAKKMKYLGERVSGGPKNVQLIRKVQPVKGPSKKILTPKKQQKSFGFGWGP